MVTPAYLETAAREGLRTREYRVDERLLDVPVSPDARELLVAQPMPALRALGPTVLRMRLLAQEAGGERLLGEYTFSSWRELGDAIGRPSRPPFSIRREKKGKPENS